MSPLSGAQVKQLREMRADGHTIVETAAKVGCAPGTVRRITPGRPGKVPNARLREVFLASDVNAGQVARRLGWWSGHSVDSSRVHRTLGLRADRSGSNGLHSFRSLIDWDTALAIGEALGLEAWEIEPEELAA